MINVSKERFHFDDEEDVVIQAPKKKAEKKPTPKEMGINLLISRKRKLRQDILCLESLQYLYLHLESIYIVL